MDPYYAQQLHAEQNYFYSSQLAPPSQLEPFYTTAQPLYQPLVQIQPQPYISAIPDPYLNQPSPLQLSRGVSPVLMIPGSTVRGMGYYSPLPPVAVGAGVARSGTLPSEYGYGYSRVRVRPGMERRRSRSLEPLNGAGLGGGLSGALGTPPPMSYNSRTTGGIDRRGSLSDLYAYGRREEREEENEEEEEELWDGEKESISKASPLMRAKRIWKERRKTKEHEEMLERKKAEVFISSCCMTRRDETDGLECGVQLSEITERKKRIARQLAGLEE